jgi:hypothetical protein
MRDPTQHHDLRLRVAVEALPYCLGCPEKPKKEDKADAAKKRVLGGLVLALRCEW